MTIAILLSVSADITRMGKIRGPKKFNLSGELYYGRALGIFNVDGGEAIQPVGFLGDRGVRRRGGWMQAQFNFREKWQMNLAHGIDASQCAGCSGRAAHAESERDFRRRVLATADGFPESKSAQRAGRYGELSGCVYFLNAVLQRHAGGIIVAMASANLQINKSSRFCAASGR
jgi:hypothetical protein